MSQFSVHSSLNYTVHNTTSFLLKIAVERNPRQTLVSESLELSPQVNIENCRTDLEENLMYRISLDPCELQLDYRATVTLGSSKVVDLSASEVNISEIPPDVLPYLNPSRYCESDLLTQTAMQQFGSMPRGAGRVQSICDWVNQQLQYTPGSTNASSTATQVLSQGQGVCRDYAHVMISICRALCIPARYVSGYALGLEPPDFHGFVEVFLEGNWYFFDPTKLAAPENLVRISTGRDAADVAFATITGNATLNSKMVSVTATEQVAAG